MVISASIPICSNDLNKPHSSIRTDITNNSRKYRTQLITFSLCIYFNIRMILWSKNIVNCIWCWSLEPVEECGKYMSGHLSHSSLFSDHIPEKHGAAQP